MSKKYIEVGKTYRYLGPKNLNVLVDAIRTKGRGHTIEYHFIGAGCSGVKLRASLTNFCAMIEL